MNVNVTVNSRTRIVGCLLIGSISFLITLVYTFSVRSLFQLSVDLFSVVVPHKNIFKKMGRKEKATESLFTKEEEQLLSDFSRNVSTKSSALFYGSAFMVSLLPICEYTYIQIYYVTRNYLFPLNVHRALLENTHDRNDAGPRMVRSRHVGKHLPHRFCVQKYEVHIKT